MSMSLRDQLLKAGLISQKQARDAERQQERQERQPAKRAQQSMPTPPRPQQAAAGKAARDQELNRQQQEKARKKALQAQIKQLIEQNRLPPVEGDDCYNFVDGNKVRRVVVNAALRGSLTRGEIVIVRHEGRYSLVPASLADRIRERDESAVIAAVAEQRAAESVADDGYKDFAVPDDLIW